MVKYAQCDKCKQYKPKDEMVEIEVKGAAQAIFGLLDPIAKAQGYEPRGQERTTKLVCKQCLEDYNKKQKKD